MDSKENMKNKENMNQSVGDVDILDTNCKFYKRGNMPIVYDNFLQIPFKYVDGKWEEMSRGTFNDNADEITEANEITMLFTDKVRKDYINTLQKVYTAIKKVAELQKEKDKNQIGDLEKKL